MEIIVFSGITNTGKSTAIRDLETQILKAGKTVKIYDERSRIYLDSHSRKNIDIYKLQKFILEWEKERLQELEFYKKEKKFDYILVDRTATDGMVFIYWALINWTLKNAELLDDSHSIIEKSREIYDKIIYFYEMIKTDSRAEGFNSKEFHNIFENTIKTAYKDKVNFIRNNIYLEKETVIPEIYS